MAAQIQPILVTVPLSPRHPHSVRTIVGLSVAAMLFLVMGGGDLIALLIAFGFIVQPVQAVTDKLIRWPRQDRADAEALTRVVREYFYNAPAVDAKGVRELVAKRQLQVNDDGGGQLRLALTGRRKPTAAGSRPEARLSFKCGDVGLMDFDRLLQNAENDPPVRRATDRMRRPGTGAAA
ncbi:MULTISPECIES: hypothetical protein [unclassified Arthrobacter]|uniref:hypothetical protein n=1 Tax=unclassified Arthrobacter TaxID=235627 RepID=UPI0021073641|nr:MULTISPECIES: hypothetical protein [unclassified Arthrobacter]MCQ1947426.1 hypothetical protein [Arthrobacter sp. zg-Y1116]MCQ1987378.1 hypothetical protein [Arthrobacter sp. zg-Y844]MCQ1996722.1 hypothetical protein [Arthrobacter sp. zg-Y1171]UWX82320.1 hypothetical protein N2L00_02470 [Arthrobacter sp. zg-Y1171]